MKALFDTNILLDVFLERSLFAQSAAECWAVVVNKAVVGVVTPVTLANIFYLIKRNLDRATAEKSVDLVLSIFEVEPCGAEMLTQASAARWNDFEDAIQYFAAVQAKCDVLITRNTRDFKRLALAIETPTEFLRDFR